MKVARCDFDSVDEKNLKYAVILTKYNDEWVYVRHKERTTWEFPGGSREIGESILETAKRELVEETGATEYEIQPISYYSVTANHETTYGLLCFAEVRAFEKALTMEIKERRVFESLPKNMTYPEIQPRLLEIVEAYLESENSMD